jgi:hypothetical protein
MNYLTLSNSAGSAPDFNNKLTASTCPAAEAKINAVF